MPRRRAYVPGIPGHVSSGPLCTPLGRRNGSPRGAPGANRTPGDGGGGGAPAAPQPRGEPRLPRLPVEPLEDRDELDEPAAPFATMAKIGTRHPAFTHTHEEVLPPVRWIRSPVSRQRADLRPESVALPAHRDPEQLEHPLYVHEQTNSMNRSRLRL